MTLWTAFRDWLRESLEPARREALRDLEIRARVLVDSMRAGAAPSVRRGSGIETATVRKYEAGDDARALDWRVTARRGELHVRTFEEEQDLDVLLVVDRSASLQRAAYGLARDVVTDCAAALSLAATEAGHRVGLVTFTDRTEQLIPPSRLRNQWRSILWALDEPPAGTRTDLAGALRGAEQLMGARGMVVVISDFDLVSEPDAAVGGALAHLAGRHDVVPVVVRVPSVADLPDVGVVRVRDPETGRVRVIDTRGRRDRPTVHEDAIQRLREMGLEPVSIDARRNLRGQLAVRFGRARRRAA